MSPISPVHTRGPLTIFTAKRGTGGSPDLYRADTRLADIGAFLQKLTHDADGNLTSDGIADYQYDAENRLIRMETTLMAQSWNYPHRLLEFRYDYLGRRVQKRVVDLDQSPGVEISCRRYLYDGWNLVAEYLAPNASSLGALVRSYTWGLDIVNSLADSGGVGALLQIADHPSGKTYLPSYDGNGNIASLTNAATGALSAIYEYSPYGESLRSQILDSTIADNPFRFSTKFTDLETGLVYYGHRFYDPKNGRFINRDPIEEAGGMNLYGFCGNDGVNGFDVLGCDGWNPTALLLQGNINFLTSALAAPGLDPTIRADYQIQLAAAQKGLSAYTTVTGTTPVNAPRTDGTAPTSTTTGDTNQTGPVFTFTGSVGSTAPFGSTPIGSLTTVGWIQLFDGTWVLGTANQAHQWGGTYHGDGTDGFGFPGTDADAADFGFGAQFWVSVGLGGGGAAVVTPTWTHTITFLVAFDSSITDQDSALASVQANIATMQAMFDSRGLNHIRVSYVLATFDGTMLAPDSGVYDFQTNIPLSTLRLFNGASGAPWPGYIPLLVTNNTLIDRPSLPAAVTYRGIGVIANLGWLGLHTEILAHEAGHYVGYIRPGAQSDDPTRGHVLDDDTNIMFPTANIVRTSFKVDGVYRYEMNSFATRISPGR